MCHRFVLCVALFALGCSAASTREAPPALAQPSNLKIAIEVDRDSKFGREVSGKLREEVLATGIGVPVTSATDADLVLRVSILAMNLTNATDWEWQIVHRATGSIVSAKTEQAVMGRNAGPLARDIVEAMGTLDLTPYQSGATAVAAAQSKPSTAPQPWPASSTDGSNAWAVIIGIESYREELSTVSGARADAEAFAAYAKATLNVPEANVRVLLGERASRADVAAALLEWLPRNAVTPGGRVYVFFSGHGAPDVQDGSAYLVPYDANPSYLKSSALRLDEVQASLAALPDQATYLFVDACFSGTGDRSVVAQGTRPVLPVKEVAAVGGLATLSAAGSAQTSGAVDGGAHGLFTYHLLEALRGGADVNGDAQLTMAEVHTYVVDRVTVDARRQNREQTPTLAASEKARHAPLVTGLEK